MNNRTTHITFMVVESNRSIEIVGEVDIRNKDQFHEFCISGKGELIFPTKGLKVRLATKAGGHVTLQSE